MLFVLAGVNRLHPRRDTPYEAPARHFVKIAPPSVHAGVGNALREAFAMNGEMQPLPIFEELLAKLN